MNAERAKIEYFLRLKNKLLNYVLERNVTSLPTYKIITYIVYKEPFQFDSRFIPSFHF